MRRRGGDAERRQHRGQFDAPAGQALAQALPRPHHPDGDRAFGNAQPAAGLGVCHPFQATQDEGAAIGHGQLLDLLIEHFAHLAPGQFSDGIARGSLSGLPFVGSPACRRTPRLQGDADGCAVQPGGQRLAAAKAAGLAHQDQEGRLAGVFGVVLVAEDAPALPQHDPTVTAHDGRERLGVLAFGEGPEQVGVAAVVGVEAGAELTDGGKHMLLAHG
jgi:hypothetical protein